MKLSQDIPNFWGYKIRPRDCAGLASLGRRGPNHSPMLQRVKILKTPVRAEYPTDLSETYSVDVASQGLQIQTPGPLRPRFARPARTKPFPYATTCEKT